MLMGSRECYECVSEFLSTVDYVLVRSVSIARLLLMGCKFSVAIPLAPGCTRVTKKHRPALYPSRLEGLISTCQEALWQIHLQKAQPFH